MRTRTRAIAALMLDALTSKCNVVAETISLGARRVAALNRARCRFGYIGGHGYQGLGDNAMFNAARRLLPDDEVITFDLPWHEQRLAKVGLAGRMFFDSVILGGGTLINPMWHEKTRLALCQRLPVWALGTGVGSCGFQQEELVDLRAWRPLLADFTRIGVRGPRSKAALEAVGVGNVEVVGDLACTLAQDESPEPATPPRVAVNVSGGQVYGQGEYERLNELEHALGQLVRQGWRVVWVALDPADVEPMSELMARMGLGHYPMPVLSTPAEFFRAVGPCTFTVAVRLHAAVLSACVGVPSLMLSYRDKCADFMDSMGLQDWVVRLRGGEPGEIAEKTLELSRHAGAMRAGVLSAAQAWGRTIEEYVRSVR
ncbi:MAG: polysaccharide pyruvyl transferase family protein [Tepidisphaeraceae bacterium]